MKEFKIEELKGVTFRIRKMNGIEAIASRQVLVKASEGDLITAYNMMLEKYIDVQVDKDNWLRCKSGENYYPNGLENNVNALMAIMNEFVQYVSSFFSNSNA